MPPISLGFDTTAEYAAEVFADQIRGRTVLTTGVSPQGLGAKFVQAIAKQQPKLLILAARDVSKANATAQVITSTFPNVTTRVLVLDLGSQTKIRKAAGEVNAYEEHIDVLVNNAGIMGGPYATTEEGLESHIGTNHIGHFLFTNLIMEKILAAGPSARIVNISSDASKHSSVQFDDINFSDGRTYDQWKAYGQSKTANILFSVALAEKLGSKGILSFSVHPGVIADHLPRSVMENPMILQHVQSLKSKTISQGAATSVVAAFDPSLADHNGAYLIDCQISLDVMPYAIDKGNAERLWKISEEFVGESFSY